MLDGTPLFRLHARRRERRLRAQDAAAEQRRQLLALVAKARDTRFGTDHRFRDIATVEAFQSRVPLRRYEAFWEEYWRDGFPRLSDRTWPGVMPYFALTSGTTTGVTKYIPCSREMTVSNRRAALDLLVHHVIQRPHSRLFAGRNFMLGGSTGLAQLAPGIACGDLSGIAARLVPWWIRPRYFPPRRLDDIGDWETRIAALAPLSLRAGIRAISGAPNWLLIFFDKLAELRPGPDHRLCNFYPDLELVVHGGVSFAPYRDRFAHLLDGGHAETREVYAASEAFVAVADRGDGEGMRLIVDNGVFYEFVPVEELESARPKRHWVANLELGVNYAVAVSSCAGLWGYMVGDTVTFIDRDPPRLLITGRTSYTLSAFGEHLIDEEIEECVAHAAAAIGADVTDYSVGPLTPERQGEVGRHLFVVEFAEAAPAPARLDAFARALDEALSATNADYRSLRAQDIGLRPPVLRALAPGTFAAWMKSRGQLGGQHKVPRIINDPDLFAALREFTEREG